MIHVGSCVSGPELLRLLETLPPEQVCQRMGACHPDSPFSVLAGVEMSSQLKRDVAFLLQRAGTVYKSRTCANPIGHTAALQEASLAIEEPSESCRFCEVRRLFPYRCKD
jgi:hypothetical protein